jgi:hypothetical protein
MLADSSSKRQKPILLRKMGSECSIHRLPPATTPKVSKTHLMQMGTTLQEITAGG